MTCKDCSHSGLCYKENDYENFPDRCGSFIPDKVLDERPQGDLISREALLAEFKERNIWSKDIVEAVNNTPAVEIATKLQPNCNNLQQGQQGELKEYKPLELDYNVQCAVENLRVVYWSNESEKVAKNFTEAEDIIISAICHHGYAVCKQTKGKWKDYSDEGYVECPFCGCCTNCEDNIAELHYCWNCGAKMEKGGVGDAL